MTDKIINFPTLEERDALEFDRFGTSSLTRALDEAIALDSEPQSFQNRSAMLRRVLILTGLVGRLASQRPGTVDEFVVVDCGDLIPLRDMPARLRLAWA